MGQRNWRILVAEDNDAIRSILFEYLSSQGLDVEITRNGVEALDAFVNKGFDLVLTDLQMPLMDGHELACEIKKKRPKTVIIMMSGNRPNGGQAQAVADFFVVKPFQMKDISDMMNWALQSRARELALPLSPAA